MDRLSTFLLSMGFFYSTTDPSLFINHSSHGTLLLLLFVDDMVLTGNNPIYFDPFIDQLGREFAIKDLEQLYYFLGVEVYSFSDGLFLSQTKYARDLLDRAQMVGCLPISTPIATKVGLNLSSVDLFPDLTHYCSIVGALQYLTFTRPDPHCVNFLCQFMHAPTMGHYKIVKRILRYISRTLDYGMRILAQSFLDL